MKLARQREAIMEQERLLAEQQVCICVFVYLCICVCLYVYLCVRVFVFVLHSYVEQKMLLTEQHCCQQVCNCR